MGSWRPVAVYCSSASGSSSPADESEQASASVGQQRPAWALRARRRSKLQEVPLVKNAVRNELYVRKGDSRLGAPLSRVYREAQRVA